MNNIQPMSPSTLADAYGVSLPVFLAWIRCAIINEGENSNITFYKRKFKSSDKYSITHHWVCVRKFIPPAEQERIYELLGRPVNENNYPKQKTTLSSIAESKDVPIKSFIRFIKTQLDEEEYHFRDLGTTNTVFIDDLHSGNKQKGVLIRCLTPKQADLVIETYG